MKRIGSVMVCCLGVAAISAGTALAGNGNSTPNPKQVASKQCASELHATGVKQFKLTYGDGPKHQHAMRNCKRKQTKFGKNQVNNAAQECRAEQADPNFAATHGGTFEQVYGTNKNGKNAFGKCVSGKVSAAQAQLPENAQNAARQCREERLQLGGEAFKSKYGTPKSKRKNAFGKCVSQKAKAQGVSPTPTPTA